MRSGKKYSLSSPSFIVERLNHRFRESGEPTLTSYLQKHFNYYLRGRYKLSKERTKELFLNVPGKKNSLSFYLKPEQDDKMVDLALCNLRSRNEQAYHFIFSLYESLKK